MVEFNTAEPIGSLYELSYKKTGLENIILKYPLVNFVAYCLNPNHFHFILEQVVDNGISNFMKRLGGYSWFYNNKHKRTGTLFEGRFKAVHIDSDRYLSHLSAYVSLNDKCHQLGGPTAKLVRSSWAEYMNEIHTDHICTRKDIILEQFGTISAYRKFAMGTLEDIIQRKRLQKEMGSFFLD